MYSRRSFLKTGATVAAASLFPSSALPASIATLGSDTDPDAVPRARVSQTDGSICRVL
jgi:hypothetical protein